MRIIVLSVVLSLFGPASWGMSVEDAWKHPANARFAKAIGQCIGRQRFFVIRPGVRPAPPVAVSRQKLVRLHPSLLDAIKEEARQAGIDPIVMLAIEWHETGAYTSSLWRRANNPGGIKFRHFASIESKRSGMYCSFKSIRDGIHAHALVLSHPRYDAARKVSDPISQIAAIGRAGYCKPLGEWGILVKKYARRFNGGSLPSIVFAQAD